MQNFARIRPLEAELIQAADMAKLVRAVRDFQSRSDMAESNLFSA